MRTLYYIPIIHDPTEREFFLQELLIESDGEEDVQKISTSLSRAIKKYWGQIKQKVENENLDYSRVFIYQDTIGIREDRDGSKSEVKEIIIRRFKEIGTPNFLFLAELLEKGATLRGTENGNLLFQFKEILQKRIYLKKAKVKALNDNSLSQKLAQIEKEIETLDLEKVKLLQKRDRFIAQRINQTLPEGGIGILFIGGAHRVDRKLQKFPNLEIIYLSDYFGKYWGGEKMKTESNKQDSQIRILYYAPIIFHTPTEYGSLAKSLEETESRGDGSPKAYTEKAWGYWEKIRRVIKEEGLNTPEKCKTLHIYIDGLPRVEDYLVHVVVEESIKKGVPQYLIIQKLLEKGATIHGTESIELLQKEKDALLNAIKGIKPDPKQHAELLQKRDKFIAKVINETLPKGELGLLFIGRGHDIVEELNKLEERGELTSPLKVLYLFKFIYRIGG